MQLLRVLCVFCGLQLLGFGGSIVLCAHEEPAVAIEQPQPNDDRQPTGDQTQPSADPADQNDVLQLRTQVIADQAGTEIFPSSWRKPEINASATPLIPTDRERSRMVVARALAKYPTQILNQHLKQIYLLEGLRFREISAGGTNSRDTVYVSGPGAYSERNIERIFHAEFSSILLRNYSQEFDHQQWSAINPDDFTYGIDGVDAIRKNKAATHLDDSLHESGFLSTYATSNLENDFNSYASLLLTGSSELWSIAEAFPRVRAKLNHAVAFYQQIDPAFTEEFFRSLAPAPEQKPEAYGTPQPEQGPMIPASP